MAKKKYLKTFLESIDEEPKFTDNELSKMQDEVAISIRMGLKLADRNMSKSLEEQEELGSPMYSYKEGDIYYANNAIWIKASNGKRYYTVNSEFDF